LQAVERVLRDMDGVTAIIFDQTCAAEKRRRRKTGDYPDPPLRAFINTGVCENCGDCSAQSNCMSVVPVETELGRKRQIDQSSCNKDYSCVDGFCPSFVTVKGGQLRKGRGEAALDWVAALPDPGPAPLDGVCSILIAGVGGTGVVTVGAVLGAAAALEGKAVSALDMAGLAQKGGPVTTHLRIAAQDEDLHATRISSGEAAVLIGCDIVVSSSPEVIFKLRPGFTRAIVNDDFSITSEFVRAFAAQATTGDLIAHPDPVFQREAMEKVIADACGQEAGPIFCGRPASPRRCSAIPSPPIFSCSAMPIKRACCLWRRLRSSRRSKIKALRSSRTGALFSGAVARRMIWRRRKPPLARNRGRNPMRSFRCQT